MISSINNYTIVITGLGGQGLIKLIQILGDSLVRKGYKVITSEKHGLSQRGGMVTCFLRFGDKIGSPIPILGSAEMIIATEKSCVLNVLNYAKLDKSTKFIIADYRKEIVNSEYPSDKFIIDTLKAHSKNLDLLSTETLPKNKKSTNTFILGYILRYIPIKLEDIERALTYYFSGDSLVLNLDVLKNGNKLILHP